MNQLTCKFLEKSVVYSRSTFFFELDVQYLLLFLEETFLFLRRFALWKKNLIIKCYLLFYFLLLLDLIKNTCPQCQPIFHVGIQLSDVWNGTVTRMTLPYDLFFGNSIREKSDPQPRHFIESQFQRFTFSSISCGCRAAWNSWHFFPLFSISCRLIRGVCWFFFLIL